MQKTFVLSTKSLLSSENSTQRFGTDNEIVIPMAILENLQRFQGTVEEKKMAQKILEYIESFSVYDLYHEGAIQENGSILRICDDCPDEKIEINVPTLYKRCFQICKNLSKTHKNVIFISKDPVIRIKAREIGIQAQNFKDDLFPKLSEQYTGRVMASASSTDIDKLMQTKEAPKEIIWEHEKIDWYANLFLNVTTDKGSVIIRYDGKKLVPLRFTQRDYPDHLKTKNAGQVMAMECLLAYPQDAPLVIIKGGAGTGKTFCSLAVALEHLKGVGREKRYRQVLVATPQITVAEEDIGALPGNIDKKVGPKLGGIYDNLKVLLNPEEEEEEEEKKAKRTNKKDDDEEDDKGKPLETGEELFKRRLIEIQPIGFLRGRTIPKTIFIIDETQNIEPHVIKTIITRAAKGSKFIFLGDPSQVDNPKLNERYNGLVYVSEKFKNYPLAWQVTLTENESVRSPLAQHASKIL